jgi:predicted RecB family endonuclease
MTSDARPLDLRTSKARGDHAERRALAHLVANGLVPVERNYRVARGPSARGGEVDLILRDRDGTLVFVEVRARATSSPACRRCRLVASMSSASKASGSSGCVPPSTPRERR